MKKAISQQLIFAALLLVLWQALAMLKIWPPYVYPTPVGVGEAFRAGFSNHNFQTGIFVSLRRVSIGFAISVILGILLGALLTQSKVLENTLGRLVLSLQSLPSLCWLPLAVLWFGRNEKAILFVTVIGSFSAVALNTKTGFDHVPRIYAMAGRNLGAKGVPLFRYVLFPASLPYLVSGLRQGWAFAWRSLISGEMIFVTVGLGELLIKGRDLNNINQVVAIMMVIAAIGYLIEGIIFRTIEARIRERWGLVTAS